MRVRSFPFFASLSILFFCLLLLPADPANADDLRDFFPSLAARGILVPVDAELTYSGGGKRLRFGTNQGFGSARASFDDVDALTLAGDALVGDSPSLPIGSAVSAFSFTFDPSLNVFAPSSDSFGPLFSERAETTGRGKVNVSFSFTYVDFDIFEGERLSDLELQIGDTEPFGDTDARFAVGSGNGQPSGRSWAIAGSVRNSGTAPGGEVRRSFVNSNCSAGSACSFSNNGFGGFGDGGSYDVRFDLPTPDVKLDADIRAKVFNFFLNYGVTDKIDVGIVIPYIDVKLRGTTTSLFPDGTEVSNSDRDSSSGIGDIILRGKVRLHESELVDLGARLDVWLPTGDSDNLRGFGDPAFGALFIASSTFGRFSPHANLGVIVRGGGKRSHQLRYTIGTDIRVTDRLSLTTDLVALDSIHHRGVGDFQLALGTGIKVNPWRRLVISASALWKLNREGLRADVIPSVSAEYTF